MDASHPGPFADASHPGPGPFAHGGHGSHGEFGAEALGPLLVIALVLAAYLVAAARLGRDGGRPWSRWRAGAFAAGAVALAAALSPPLSSWAHEDFRGHMAQHLLIGMYAPLGLVLGAPVTLVLRAAGPAAGRRIGRLLGSAPMHALAHPVTALLLNAGGLYALYATPLYEATAARPFAHELVHVHFLLSGCLFAWAVAGPDPAPRRPPVPVRLVVMGAAIAAHATLAQLMYAGLLDVRAPAVQVMGGAELMYYGGDIAEILLAVALIATWRPRRAGARRSAAPRPVRRRPGARPRPKAQRAQ
ncbi:MULTISPECIES: cytochrome c oxidase assembly protein [Actinomadura]|uniref:Cytochrome c oxidase assembly protein n=1 Tax=Actinomadura yumaensis TaxID=111807 RepID=A0ABW2CU72_9ACTN|nr:cytochrome c oxidase assembly protein [Actinomadura sp. J1-007]